MANPQPDLYTKISTELLEQVCKIRIPGEAMQIFLSVIRRTWGYGKKTDAISMGQFSEYTGLPRSSVSRAIKKLIEMNLITKKETMDNPIGVNLYSIQKNYELWRVFTKTLTAEENGVYENVNTPPGLFENEQEKSGVYKEVKHFRKLLTKKSPTIDKSYNTSINTTTTTTTYNTTYNNYNIFEELWKLYPRKIGKPDSYKWFKKSIKIEQDLIDIKTALNNYLKYIDTHKPESKYIKHGSAWFHVWRDWVEYEEYNPTHKKDDSQRKIDEDKLRKHTERKEDL